MNKDYTRKRKHTIMSCHVRTITLSQIFLISLILKMFF